MPEKERQLPRPGAPKKDEEAIQKPSKGPFDDILDDSEGIIEEAEKQQQKGRKGGQ